MRKPPQINSNLTQTTRSARFVSQTRPLFSARRFGCTISRFLFSTICVLGVCAGNIINAPLAAATDCQDVQFIFARGSGEPLTGRSFVAWRDNIIEQLGDTSLRYDFYELGTRSVGGYQYPASPVSGSLAGIGNLIGAAISGGAAFEFGRSVQQGIGELKSYLARTSASCSRTQYVLGGYSQGAMLISGILDELNPDKIIYVTTFGDPKLYLPEGNPYFLGSLPQIPAACSGQDLSNYRLHVPDCFAYEGILGSYRPYQTSGYVDKLGTWCNEYDVMCSSGLNFADHSGYISSDLYHDAARVVAEHIKITFSNRKFSPVSSVTSNLAEVAILLDSTGSMSSLINQYKAEAERLATQVLSSHGHIALYDYRDLQNGYRPRQHCDFTCTIDQFRSSLQKITTSGGGDEPESGLSAIMTAMNSLKWSPGATKSIVLLTDAPYLNPDRDGITLAQVIQRSLEIDPVNIYVLTNDPSVAETYLPLTDGTNGRVFDLDSELTLSTEAILNRPVARLSLSSYLGVTGSPLTFDASRSYTTDDSALHYDWDLDGDGIFEYTDRGATISETYLIPTEHYIRVKVYTSTDNFSTMTAKVTVRRSDSLHLAEITDLSAAQTAPGAFRLTFRTDAEQVLLLVDEAILGFLPVQNGEGDFTLQDLVGTVTVTLVPYAQNLRGQSARITLDSIVPKVPNTAAHNLPNDPFFLNSTWDRYLNVLAYRQSAN